MICWSVSGEPAVSRSSASSSAPPSTLDRPAAKDAGRAARRTRSSSFVVMGLLMKSSIPDASHALRSSVIAFAVSAITRGCRSRGSSARMRRVASMPSTSGMRTSISTTSYGRARTASTASTPLPTTSAR